ncbi:MAG TPA: hypothetical protein VFW27_05280 [Actinoplanes sp.]|nr:hypothetical protein [Actinoplanes sp.]
MSEVITIVQERLPYHPRLGRNIRVDSRSLAFPYQPVSQIQTDGDWKRHVGPFDQGEVGSCTGNAAIGCMATGLYFESLANFQVGFLRFKNNPLPFSLDEAGAVACYEAATVLDSYPGTYPPNDTGSDGTAVAQALKNSGMISGYTHATTGKDAALALGEGPVIAGMKWFNSMFEVGEGGRMTVDRNSGVAGGHEIVFDKIDAGAGQAWFTQSWGASWGVERDGVPGRAWFTLDDFKALVDDQGDATVFVPISAPAPAPVPVPPTPSPGPGCDDRTLWQALEHFAGERHVVPEYKNLARLGLSWGAGKGFTK